MRGAYLAVSHTARGDGETDSAMRTYVPQPSAIAPARYHASYCALRAEARFGGYAKHANALGIVGPVPQHAVRATERPTTRPLEQRNAIEQG